MNKIIKSIHLKLVFVIGFVIVSIYAYSDPTTIPEPPMVLYGTLDAGGIQNVAASHLIFEFVDQSGQPVLSTEAELSIENDTSQLVSFTADIPIAKGVVENIQNALAFGSPYTVKALLDGTSIPSPLFNNPVFAESTAIKGPIPLSLNSNTGNSPIITQVEPQTAQINVGDSLKITIKAEDADSDSLQFSASPETGLKQTSLNQVGMAATVTYEFAGNNSNIGLNTFVVYVSDGKNQVSTTISILVQDGNQSGPALVYEFDQETLDGNGWAELPGGFTQRPAGVWNLQSFIGNPFQTSEDNKGLSISVRPDEVVFLYAQQAFDTSKDPVLMRMKIRSLEGDAQLYMVGLKGSLITAEEVDGSLTLNNSAHSTTFSEQEKDFVVLYEPDDSTLLDPIIQVVGNQAVSTVLIDKLEIYHLTSTAYSGNLFASNSNLSETADPSQIQDPHQINRYEFNQSTLTESGWAEKAGGFDPTAKPGFISFQKFITNTFSTSLDQQGLAINVRPGEVSFIYAKEPIITSENPILFRLKVRATSPDVKVFLVGLQGNLSTGETVDGSIAYHSTQTASSFIDQERDLILLYKPNQGDTITPVIQVAGGLQGSSTVYVDRLDVYEIEPSVMYSSSIFRSLAK